MSQSKDALELCSFLVDEMYGELTSQIYSVLFRRGRLPTSLISKYAHLGPRQVRHGLVVLVQQNLVFHNVDEDTGLTYYEADNVAAYALVRSGKILEAVERRHGAIARDVVQNLLLLGHTKVSHLEEAYEVKQKQMALKNHNKTNIKEKIDTNRPDNFKQDQISTTGQFHSALLKLLEVGVLEEVYDHMFRSPSDTYSRIEKETLQMYFGGSTKGIKQKEELKIKVKSRLLSLRSNTQKWQTQKRKLQNGQFSNGINRMNKRRRLSNGETNDEFENSYEDDGTRLDPEMIIRVNYEKCTVFLRSQTLVVSVNNRIGKTTSLIYGDALRILENKIPRCQMNLSVDGVAEDENLPVFTTTELAAALNSHINPGSGIAEIGSDGKKIRENEKTHKSRIQSNKMEFDADFNSDEDIGEKLKSESDSGYNFDASQLYNDSGGRERKIVHVKNHLMLLAADEFKFLRKCGNAGMGEWTVDFKVIMGHLRNEELDKVFLETFGSAGLRLVRILRKLGKLDEKQLPNIALMKQKDVRTKLAELQMAGIVDIQEVPKDASRTVYRTIFLWYFDSRRVSEMFIDNVYKIMTRVIQRLNVERKRDEDILRLTQRSDVRDQDPAEYLDKGQLSKLASYHEKEETLVTQILRLDELIGIFRDY